MIEAESIRGTFLQLVKIPNPSKEEREVCDFVAERLRPCVSSMKMDDAGSRIGGNCGNLFVNIEGNAPG
ncbi:MAG: peptidase M20, partial [bacterium]